MLTVPREAAGCLLCTVQGDCIQLNGGQNVIHFLLAPLKLAIWLTRTHSVCGSGPIDPLHCSIFGPSGPKHFLYVGQGRGCVCKREHVFYAYNI